MRVPLTTNDFLHCAEVAHGDAAIMDDPFEPAPTRTHSYRDLAGRCRAIQAGLDELGVPVGARVAVISPNSARLLELLLAVPSTGRVLVPINFRLRADEVAYIVEHCDADVFLVDPELAPPLEGISARHRFLLGAESDAALLRPGREPVPWREPDEDATATINYTSGTTARPKGVELTHRNIWINAATFTMHLGVTDRDVYLHTLPMFHCNGWGLPYGLAGVGAAQHVLRRVDGTEILRRVDTAGITLMCGAPTVWRMVLDAAQSWNGEIPGAGRVRIVCAGAPPPSRLIERIEEELQWEFLQIYGLTETSPLLTINRERAADAVWGVEAWSRRRSRAGVPALGVRVGVSDAGEVLARSNVVFGGYWDDPAATEAALEDGWFHTGDGGSLDDEGYLTISDRRKDVIITGGENVSSIEVEDCLFAHDAVAEVAVIGVPHDQWGETVKALVVLADGATVTEAEIITHCKQKLAGYKAPTSVEFRDAIPRTATGKIQKYKLREPYWSEQQV